MNRELDERRLGTRPNTVESKDSPRCMKRVAPRCPTGQPFELVERAAPWKPFVDISEHDQRCGGVFAQELGQACRLVASLAESKAEMGHDHAERTAFGL